MNKYDLGKHSKDRRIVAERLEVIFVIIFISIIGYYIYNLYLTNKNKSIYEEIDISDIAVDENISSEEIAKEQSINTKKVIKLKESNKDVVGWIQIQDTIIDYPILQGEDNEYYLTHNYKKEKTKYGSIYLKKECDIKNNNSNLIIYGHNMKDKQMFNQLLNYKDENYYNEHKKIKIATEQEETEYEIVAVFKSRIFYQDEKGVFKYYDHTKFDSEEEYNDFIENCKKQELYNTGIAAEYGEQLITLVTCEYSQENGRIVIVAKK